MNEREKMDLALKDDADISIVPGKYQQEYAIYRDEIDCFLRAYALLRNVPEINMERVKEEVDYGRYFFPTSEFNILQVMNAIRRRIKPGREPFTYSDLRDMVSDVPFCEISVKSMVYRSRKENRYEVSRKVTDSDNPVNGDKRILAVKGLDLSRIEEIVARENEPTGGVPAPQLNTVSDYFTFESGIQRVKRLNDLGDLHFDLFWPEPTGVEAEDYCDTNNPSWKSSVASAHFSSTLQKNLLINTSLSNYLSDLDCEGFPVYPVDQLLLNTGDNENPFQRGYLVHRSIADNIRAVVNSDISDIIWNSQEYLKIRGQVDNLTEKLRFIGDIQNTALTPSIEGDLYACIDLIEELVSERVVTRTRQEKIRLNEQHPDSSYLSCKQDEITSKMSELFQRFFDLPLSEISEIRHLSEGKDPSGLLLE